MDISKLSRHTHLAKQAIAQALGLGKDGLKNFKPPEQTPNFSSENPLRFINDILAKTPTKNPSITQDDVPLYLCGPTGAAALLEKSLLTNDKSQNPFNSLVAPHAKKIDKVSDLNTIKDTDLTKYITKKDRNSPETAREIDWLKLLCAAILLHAHQTAQKEARIQRSMYLHTRKQPVTSKEPSTVPTPNVKKPTENAPTTLLNNRNPKNLPKPDLNHHQKKHNIQITLLADITQTDYSKLEEMAKTIQKLNQSCQTYLELATLLLGKYPQMRQITRQHIYSTSPADEKDTETDKRKLTYLAYNPIILETTLKYYFDQTRNKPTQITQERISERLVSIMDAGKHAFIIKAEDQDSIERFDIQDRILNQIDDILFPPGYVVPTPPDNDKQEAQTSIWESELKRLANLVTSLPTDLPFAVPNPYKKALKELKSKTHPVHATLRSSIKKDILSAARDFLAKDPAPLTTQEMHGNHTTTPT